VFDKGAGAQVGGGMIVSASTPAGLAKPTSGRAAISASEAAAITIAVQGTGTTAGDVTLAGFVVEFVNASNP
jgi:hypothetical protein